MSTLQEKNKDISRRWREEADKGNWDVAFKKREIGLFTASLSEFNSGN